MDIRIRYGKLLLSGFFLMGLASCKWGPLAPVRDVAYFKTHPRERINELARCELDPDRAKIHPNCVNAGRAQLDELRVAESRIARPPAQGQTEARAK